MAGKSTQDRVRDAMALSVEAVAAYEPVLASYVVQTDSWVPEPPWSARSWSIRASRSMFDRMVARWDRFAFWERIDPVGGLLRRRDRREALKGGWRSDAGSLACALLPRNCYEPVHALVVGRRMLYAVEVLGRLDAGTVGPTTRVVWQRDRAQLNWVRSRSDIKHSLHEIGFADGSWVMLNFRGPAWNQEGTTPPGRMPASVARPVG
ncbi:MULTISPECIES: hypothetical protein [unclassified Streptomyces]|uniref:hypothetical protein n=1 Tax=unclassified Streptomyces TaxID=2593676 RepID=UPI00278C7BD2|nr:MULTISPECIES: hypothetical protein [unclassified Streptomyces]